MREQMLAMLKESDDLYQDRNFAENYPFQGLRYGRQLILLKKPDMS